MFFLVVCSVVTASVPTSEYHIQKRDFNNLDTRSESFYYKVLIKFANSDLFDDKAKARIKSDLKKKELKVKFGWVLGMIWAATFFAALAVALFAVAKFCPPEKFSNDKRKQSDDKKMTWNIPSRKYGTT